jgi:hypothetical protein
MKQTVDKDQVTLFQSGLIVIEAKKIRALPYARQSQ